MAGDTSMHQNSDRAAPWWQEAAITQRGCGCREAEQERKGFSSFLPQGSTGWSSPEHSQACSLHRHSVGSHTEKHRPHHEAGENGLKGE